jgi:hypothetical protein
MDDNFEAETRANRNADDSFEDSSEDKDDKDKDGYVSCTVCAGEVPDNADGRQGGSRRHRGGPLRVQHQQERGYMCVLVVKE